MCCVADIDQALARFNELRDQDPYRIENMDTFSNLLYVKVSPPWSPLRRDPPWSPLRRGPPWSPLRRDPPWSPLRGH